MRLRVTLLGDRPYGSTGLLVFAIACVAWLAATDASRAQAPDAQQVPSQNGAPAQAAPTPAPPSAAESPPVSPAPSAAPTAAPTAPPAGAPSAENAASPPATPSAPDASTAAPAAAAPAPSDPAVMTPVELPTDGLPGAAAPAAPTPHSVDAAHLPRDLSPWSMFMAADIVVKAVMIGLAFASVVTWTVWLAKSIELMLAKSRLKKNFTQIYAASSLAEA